MKSIRERLLNISCILTLIFIFIIPLKLASIVGIPEVTSMFVSSLLEIIIVSWPVMLFVPASGLLLLLVTCLVPMELTNKKLIIYASAWFIMPLVGIIGAINATTADFAYIQVMHLAGLGAFAMSIALLLEARPEMRKMIVASLTCSTVIVCLLGLQQYFGGMDETAEFIRNRSMYGYTNTGAINAFLADKRIFSTFALPNSLAGFLILTAPVCSFFIWKVCERIDPPKTSRLIFIPLFAVVVLLTIALTRSRTTILCIATTITLFFLIYPFPKKIRGIIVVFFIVCFAAGVVYIGLSRRGFSSAETRIDYYLASLKMIFRHPWAGTGWGDFFHDYMKLKTLYHHEAPHTPHNFIFAFATQTGITGLLLSVFVLVYPLWNGAWKIFKKQISPWSMQSCALYGFTAWVLHSMLDVNLQIPASAATAAIIATIIFIPEQTVSPEEKENKLFIPLWIKYAKYPIGMIIAASIMTGGMILLRNEYEFSILKDMVSPMGKTPEELSQITPSSVKQQLLKTNKVMPYSPFPWETTAMYMYKTGNLYSARQFMDEAIKRSPSRAGFYFQMYKIQKDIGDTEASEKSLKKARELFPMNPKYKETGATSAN